MQPLARRTAGELAQPLCSFLAWRTVGEGRRQLSEGRLHGLPQAVAIFGREPYKLLRGDHPGRRG